MVSEKGSWRLHLVTQAASPPAKQCTKGSPVTVSSRVLRQGSVGPEAAGETELLLSARGRAGGTEGSARPGPRPPPRACCRPRLTQQGLDAAAALLQPLARVGGREEDGGWQTAGRGVQPEAHSGEEGLPAGDAAHFVLHALLRRVHGVALPVLNALQGLLHLQGRGVRRRSRRGWGPQFLSRWLWGKHMAAASTSQGRGHHSQSQRGLGAPKGPVPSLTWLQALGASMHTGDLSGKPISCPTPCRADCPSPGQTLRIPHTHEAVPSLGLSPRPPTPLPAALTSGPQVTTSPSALQEPPRRLQQPHTFPWLLVS